jgi:hypothetical protein
MIPYLNIPYPTLDCPLAAGRVPVVMKELSGGGRSWNIGGKAPTAGVGGRDYSFFPVVEPASVAARLLGVSG